MKREAALAALREAREPWDVLVIGGGASGLGVAVDAASRGYRTVLVEQHDFAKGTSSRSTKLVHGGVRYLKQGRLSLVLESLHERGLLCRNAPHLVRHQDFVVPVYNWWEGPFYGIGMKVYDRLAGQWGLEPSRSLTREETLQLIPTLEPEGLLGGVRYYDGQFDDARLAVHLACTVVDHGGWALNYARVVGLVKDGGRVAGAVVEDVEGGTTMEVRARVVINATGVFCDVVRRLDEPEAPRMIQVSQGAHVVLPRCFLPGTSAIMVPHTPDGRVLFAVPWHDRVIVGTTDQPMPEPALEPVPRADEVDFILSNAARYLTRDPQRSDVLSAFAGLRPLVKTGSEENTAALSRDHVILVSPAGLITLTGGKWTTYRRMAQDAMERAQQVGGLPPRACRTVQLPLHGWTPHAAAHPSRAVYGADAVRLEALIAEQPALDERLDAGLPCVAAEVVWAVREEMARTVEDVLARRTRALLLDARASVRAAPRVAALMALELGRDAAWQREQVRDYAALAGNYLV